VTKRKSVLDALKDPNAGETIKPRRKKARAKRAAPAAKKKAAPKEARRRTSPKAAKKAPKPEPTTISWPDNWVLNKIRCRGVTAANRQCGQRAKGQTKWCHAHKKQTMKSVHEAQVRKGRRKSASLTPDGKVAGATGSGSGRGGIRDVPLDRMCHKEITTSDDEVRRCSNWTVEIEDDVYDAYCVAHSSDPRAIRARETSTSAGREALKAHADYTKNSKKPIFNRDLKTQDDVAASRLKLMRKLEAGHIGAVQANVLGSFLVAASAHIERYGTHQGAEGGAGVLRLLPGMTLVEQDIELDYVMTKEELDLLEQKLAEDERAGIATPADFSEVMDRYLGLKVRPRDRSRNWTGD
jgi:hypothetical protein